ncbi:hypothetical protein [Rarobacter incanus]|nr:hypothetical protein [Rarobacter incanus]
MQVAATVYASSTSDDSNGPGALFIFAVLAGVALYYFVWNYYRNANARFKFEDTTTSQATNVQGNDAKTGSRKGLRSQQIDGRNDNDAAAQVRLELAWPAATDAIQSVLDEAAGAGPQGGDRLPDSAHSAQAGQAPGGGPAATSGQATVPDYGSQSGPTYRPGQTFQPGTGQTPPAAE